MKLTFTFLVLFLCGGLAMAQTDICAIDLLDGPRVEALANGDRVNLEFEYSTDEPGGVRIFARPFTDGALTPSYGASGSGLYTGNGTGTGFFTINSGDVTVDEVRFSITNADQSEILQEFFIPVHYEFGENGAHNFSFSENPKVASFLHGEQVSTTFDYNAQHPGGVRIFVRPLTNGGLTPGYSASGSPLFTGEGSFTANFTINSGLNVRVDSLRVTILNDDQSQLLSEFFIPVNWYWSSVKITNLDVQGGNFAANNETKVVEFDYATTLPGGFMIFPRPVTNGELTRNYGACPSPVYRRDGSNTCDFTISARNAHVDHIQVRVTNPEQTEDLLVIQYPTSLYFGEFGFRNLVMCPPSPARLAHGRRVNSYYTVNNQSGSDARIFVRPLTEGELTPGYGASGSPAYAPGATAADDFFTINSGNVLVDQVRFALTNEDQSQDLGAFILDAHYQFGDAVITSAASPEAEDYLEWKVFPNPMVDAGQLRLTARETQVVDVYLVDMLGRKVAQWPAQRLPSGTSVTLPVNRHDLRLASGTYFLHVRGAQFTVTETVIMQ
ncbi:T9SS type A sorting domain-containing protein [Lewinella sp. W8]|uniref:T9SS type A sorting domain-containing protein n=1 Tax=Lewinella sp. W8 TaxID=2528208 RepID=UPI001067E78F|nr:T9SS type A sorting domain-containing protein [Lewinella sp. W8]MTB49909.1 T9SS type A sorting domain-containing protein [Lewinella sp. W8]